MGEVQPRFLYQNLAALSATILSGSSEDPEHPAAWLRDPLRSKAWRSTLGWSVVEGVNDTIEFEYGTSFTATIAPGVYQTGTEYAAAVQAALIAADGGNGYIVTYDTSTKKFQINADDGFDIFWESEPLASAGADLGFTEGDTSGDEHVGDTAVSHGRTWVDLDFGSAKLVQYVHAIDHNLSPSGSMVLQLSASPFGALGAAPTASITLPSGDTFRLGYGSQTYRYARLLISDPENTDGYTELGVLRLGAYAQPRQGYTSNFPLDYDELSVILQADQGAHFTNLKSTRPGWLLSWSGIYDDDRDLLQGVADEVKAGRSFGFAFDVADLDDVVYGFCPRGISIAPVEGTIGYWDFGMAFVESLG